MAIGSEESGPNIAAERSPAAVLPLAMGMIAANRLPDLISNFTGTILRISGFNDAPTRLLVSCHVAAISIASSAIYASSALKKAYKAGLVNMQTIDWAHDSVIRSAIYDFTDNEDRQKQFRMMQLLGSISNDSKFEDHMLTLVRSITKRVVT